MWEHCGSAENNLTPNHLVRLTRAAKHPRESLSHRGELREAEEAKKSSKHGVFSASFYTRAREKKTSNRLVQREPKSIMSFHTEETAVSASVDNHQRSPPLQQLLTFMCVSTCLCLKIQRGRSRPTLQQQYKREEKTTRENTIKFCPLHSEAA